MAELTLKKKFSKKEFQARADEILGRLFREVSAFAETSEAAKQERRRRAEKDYFYFCRTYLPHYFPIAEAPFHHELIAMVDWRPGPDEVLIPRVIAAPREFAKTTVVTFGYVLWQIYFKRRHFIIIGSDTEDLASDLTGYLYLEMLYNERLRCDFGEMARENWSVDDFVTLNDIRLKARGRGQRIVGRKHKQFRPDLVILDDMENDGNAKSPDQVRKLLHWVLNAVYPSIDAHGSLLWIGTVWARKSALEIAVLSEEEPYCHWVRRMYRALLEVPDAAGRPVLTSLWPAKDSVEKLLKQKSAMGSVAFNLQKMNSPVNEGGVFQEPWFRYYELADLVGKQLVVAAAFDPSLEVGASADFKAVAIVGWDRRGTIYYVLDAYIRKSSLDAVIAAVYERHQQWKFWLFGVEINGFQKLVLKEFDRAAQSRGFHLPMRGIDNRAAKETRVSRLSALVERGQIRFCRGQGNQDLLIEQMLYFPSKTVHDDGPDSLEMAIRLLEGGASMGLFEFLRSEYEKLPEGRTAGPGAPDSPAESGAEPAPAAVAPAAYAALMDPFH